MGDKVPFARRVYSGRGPLVDEIVTEVAERSELVRLVHHARKLSDADLEVLIDLIVRSAGEPNGNSHRRKRRGGLSLFG